MSANSKSTTASQLPPGSSDELKMLFHINETNRFSSLLEASRFTSLHQMLIVQHLLLRDVLLMLGLPQEALETKVREYQEAARIQHEAREALRLEETRESVKAAR